MLVYFYTLKRVEYNAYDLEITDITLDSLKYIYIFLYFVISLKKC